MVDEEPLCGPCGTSKSWVWVSEILLYLFICLFTLTFLLQIMSIEDVERIMDETQEGIEYQRVCIIISMQENNHVLQGADTADELQQDLCKNHLVSHPIFFIYCQKLKVTCISVQTVSYIKTGKYFNSREKEEKHEDKVYKETMITITKRLTAFWSSLPLLPISHLHFL